MTSLRTGASLRKIPFALFALFAVVAVIAALAYAINAWQVFGFAKHVWKLPLPLCFATAVVADALSLAGLFATYLLRSAPKRVRAYAWFVFLGMTALSMAAAESFALWRRLPSEAAKNEAQPGAMVAAGAIVIALALAVHLLIVAVRHATVADVAPELPAAPAVHPKREHTTAAQQTTETPVVRERPERKPAPAVAERPKNRGRRPEAGAVARREAFARRVIEGGERPAAVASEAGVSKRAIEQWVKAHRERSTPIDPPKVNGEIPQLTGDVTI